jgi:hypothetical protein
VGRRRIAGRSFWRCGLRFKKCDRLTLGHTMKKESRLSDSNQVVAHPGPRSIEDRLRFVDPGLTTRPSVSSRPFIRIDAVGWTGTRVPRNTGMPCMISGSWVIAWDILFIVTQFGLARLTGCRASGIL